jgi:small-conductance mechanosensitive channel
MHALTNAHRVMDLVTTGSNHTKMHYQAATQRIAILPRIGCVDGTSTHITPRTTALFNCCYNESRLDLGPAPYSKAAKHRCTHDKRITVAPNSSLLCLDRGYMTYKFGATNWQSRTPDNMPDVAASKHD